MSPPPEGRDRHYWPDGEPGADRLGATQVIPARGAPKITMPPPQSADRMSLQERANAIFGEVGTKFEVTEVASGVDNVATNIRNAVAGGVAAGVGVVREVFDSVAGLFGIADNAEKIAMAAQQQLQDITNETNVPGWSGYSWSTIFSGADGTPLPSTDWATTRITIVGDDGHAGIINNSTDGDHFCTVRDIHKFATDSQSASIVVGKKWSFSEDRWTSIRLRCDSENPTQGAACWVRPGNIRIGRFSGSTNTIWYSVGQTIKPGDIVRFRCHGDNYYVLVNGKVVISWTDTGASVSKGAGFRHAAFTQEYLNGLFADQASFQIASWAMADWLPAGGTVTTPAWRLRRGAGSAVALTVGHGAQAQMPASFYTVNDLASGVTVTDLGSGQITITETGWYEIKATSVSQDSADDGASSSASGTNARASAHVANAFRASMWVLYVDGIAVEGPLGPGVATTLYLAAGQVVRPGVSASVPLTPAGATHRPIEFSGSSSQIVMIQGRSNITHVTGAPSASFTGRKVA
ncbi:minor tail protein [Gordonia phage Walrus]|uniref:Minor tail protein n=1 Tax=Gordonia phage Walrus TaxID=2517927 RepID=A0A481S2R0_9CAUD|nr:minor tail protein [Gordonia phage Walrus]QBG78421.1 minor tail protein [Gordonia phage Walrus]